MATTNNAQDELNARAAQDASATNNAVTPNTAPPVVRTHPAKLTDGDYATSYDYKYKDSQGVERTGITFASKSSIAFDVESVYKRLLNEGRTGVTTWKKTSPKLYTEDVSFLKSEKKQVTGKVADTTFADMLTTFSATLRKTAIYVRSGEYNDEIRQELVDAWNEIYNYKTK
jgi:hypothetical protein